MISMSDHGALPVNEPRTPTRSTRHGEVKEALPPEAGEVAHRRFGAAAGLLESLDTRPLHMRLRRQRWWKFW
jgi:hypothetical protein